MTLQELIQAVETLSLAEKKALITYLIDSFPTGVQPTQWHDLREFRGAAAHLRDQDAQAYVNELRSEWD